MRAVIIGVDGAAPDIFVKLEAQGLLPHISQLRRRGAHGVLRSTVPPISAPAWATFLTGVNPGKHGVYSFQTTPVARVHRRIINSADIQAPRLAHLLNAAGFRVGQVNLPVDYPAEPIQGYMVCGMLSPQDDVAVAYPPELESELRAGGYIVDPHLGRHEFAARTPQALQTLAESLARLTRERANWMARMCARYPVDVLVGVFVALDRLQHYAWHYVERVAQDAAAHVADPVCRAVLDCFRAIDDAVGTCQSLADSDGVVCVVSDHGFGAHTHNLYLNKVLQQHGLLRLRASHPLRGIAKRYARALKQLLPRALLLRGRQALAVSQVIDWDATSAWCGSAGDNAVFVAGGRPGEISTDAHATYAARAQHTLDVLHSLNEPLRQPVLLEGFLRDAIYHGEQIGLAPDIVLNMQAGVEISPEIPLDDQWLRDVTHEGRGMHHPDGMVILCAPEAQTNLRIHPAHLQDILPTLLYLLKLPIPSHLDGEVMTSALSADVLAARPVQRSESAAGFEPSSNTMSDEDEQHVRSRLAALGYLD